MLSPRAESKADKAIAAGDTSAGGPWGSSCWPRSYHLKESIKREREKFKFHVNNYNSRALIRLVQVSADSASPPDGLPFRPSLFPELQVQNSQ